ncbi:DNA translocase FtsK 4TM domain-containing protein [Gammaproteobacteria bacterium]|nr:DNA translocase FtsK 4TM domain-containing protein [Gammaproteobacteria bacterium]
MSFEEKKDWSLTREIVKVIFIAMILFLVLSLVSYDINDQSFSHFTDTPIKNWMGQLGSYAANSLFYIFGWPAYFLLAFFLAVFLKRSSDISKLVHWFKNLFGILLTQTALCAFVAICMPFFGDLPSGSGGVLGTFMSWKVLSLANLIGSSILFGVALLIGLILLFNQPLSFILRKCLSWTAIRPSMFKKKKAIKITAKSTKPALSYKKETKPEHYPKLAHAFEGRINQPSAQIDAEYIKSFHERLEKHLEEFGVLGKVVGSQVGPVIIRFEFLPEAGTKVSRVTNLSKDLARSLLVKSVRIVEVIPGKSVIGIEVPNKKREIVVLGHILKNKILSQTSASLPLVLGLDISGKPAIADLAKMPHLLVAGTTGSGKSVGINTMLMSLLNQHTPHTLKLILIDPKQLELSVYDGISHLLCPVITDMKDASVSLNWCIAEMERRYGVMAKIGVRNFEGYNEKITRSTSPIHVATKDNPDGKKPLQKLPFIVVVVDEFADLVMVEGKKIETLIARIAQKARAAGIHLILATQRPSVDVITGLIKANIPSRIAFQVSSRIDSRTILDQQGAEQLLGAGDMLYLPPGSGVPQRVHGAYIGDDEVHRVIKLVKSYKGYNNDEQGNILDQYKSDVGVGGLDDSIHQDDLIPEVKKFLIQSQRASISSIQRQFRIGFNRAANIIESLEKMGVVSQVDGSGQRKVLQKEG